MKRHSNCSILTAAISLATLLGLIAGCASQVPEPIRTPAAGEVQVGEVVADDTQRWRNQTVRWGGSILEIDNRADATWLTVLAFPLDSDGEPQTDENSSGRFIAIVPRFLEPTHYSEGRSITIRGPIGESETRKVGEYPYRYPLVDVEHHYLWPEAPERSEQARYPWWWYDPWYYDPWYFPYTPHHRFLH